MNGTAGFVGRRDELHELEALIRHAADAGSAAAVLIAGEAGVGKTRLVQEACDRFTHGMVKLEGSCVPLSQGELPYGAIIEAFRTVGSQIETAVQERVFGSSGAASASLFHGSDGVTSDGSLSSASQTRLFEQVLGVVSRLASHRPLLMVIEDLHWSGASTRDLLSFLVANSRDIPAVYLFTFRTDELHRDHPVRRFASNISSRRDVLRVELNRFSLEEMSEQLTALFGHAPSGRRLEEIRRRSQGNPLFTELLASTPGGHLPESLFDLMTLRLEAISPTARQLLRAVAVATNAPAEDLQAIAGMHRDEFEEAWREATSAQIVENPDGILTFKHALMAEAIYEDLPPTDRATMHASVARLIEERTGGIAAASTQDAALIAHHWSRSGRRDRALESALVAGIRASESYAFGEAAVLLHRAHELWDGTLPEGFVDLTRSDVLRLAAECASLDGEVDSPLKLIQEAIVHARDLDPTRQGILHERLGRYRWNAGDGFGSLEAYKKAVSLVPEEPPSHARAKVLASLGQILMLLGNYREAIERCREAIGIAHDLGAAAIEAHALATLGPALGFSGKVEEAIAALSSARDTAERIADPENVGRAIINLATILAADGRYENSKEVAIEGQATAYRWGISSSFGTWMKAEVAFRELELGNWVRCEEVCHEILSGDTAGYVEVIYGLLAQLAVARGEAERAQEYLSASRAAASSWRSIEFEVPILLAEAELHMIAGDLPAARRAIDEGLALTSATDDALYEAALCWASIRVEASDPKRGDAERVGDALSKIQSGSRIALRPIAAHAAAARGEAAIFKGEDARGTFTEAARLWREMKHPYLTAYCLFRLGVCHLVKQDRASAEGALSEGFEIASTIGSRWMADAITQAALKARLPVGNASMSDGPTDPLLRTLTPRELEVLKLMAEGMSNKQIANHLFISVKTTSVHVSRILMKLGLDSRVEAAAYAFRAGLMSDEPLV